HVSLGAPVRSAEFSPEAKFVEKMPTPPRLTLGLAGLVALSLFAACQQTPARADARARARNADARARPAEASDTIAPAEASDAVAPVEARWDDSDSDGIPDREELRSFGDRESFREWFTAIAEQQFYEPSKEWNADQRDCAGLVRFAWREALRAHNRAWFLRMGESYDPVAPDVRAYTLERSPVGEKLFRTTAGSFDESNLSDGTFSEFADARTLKEFNARFVSRDPSSARPGDLLFFRQPWVQKYPYHVMIYLGRARKAAEGADDWVVYHTGSSPADAGEVRKVRLAVLAHHPDARWRPVAANRNFLGFYRLKILE
ncbi:MAG: DUF1175 domain-containing protein, partial [Acidobacteriota bacterium]|nr:DUF1175 domain-containing protein [Acidobacteriota bacterium]